MAQEYGVNIRSTADTKAVDNLKDSVDDAKKAVDDLTGATAAPDSDTAALEDVTTASEDAVDAVGEVSDSEAAPTSDTSGLDDVTVAADDAVTAIEAVSEAEAAPSSDTSALDAIASSAGDAQSAVDGLSAQSVDIDTSGAEEGLGGVESSAGGADGALQSIVSKTIAKFPGLGEALGPLTKSFGTMASSALLAGQAGETAGAEVAAGAETAEASLGPMIAVMLVAAVVLKGLTAAFDDSKEEADKAFHAEQVKSFTEAIEDSGNAVENLAEGFKKAGEVKISIGDLGQLDLTPVLARNGISIDQYAAAIAGGQASLDAFKGALDAAGVSSEDQTFILGGATQGSEDYSKASEKAAQFTAVFGDKAAEAARKTAEEKVAVDQAKQSVDEIKAAEEQHTDQLKLTVDELQSTIDKQRELTEVNRDGADAAINVRDKSRDYADSIDRLNELVASGEASQRDLEAAQDAATLSAGALADAQVELKVKQDEANGVTTSAKDKQDAWNQAMLTASATATGPAKQAIIDYINQANGIPAEKATEISAAIQSGDIETATRLINEASKTRDASIKLDVDNTSLAAVNAELDRVAHDRFAKYGGNYVGAGAHAAGTESSVAGIFDVGEQGPERIYLPAGAKVANATQTAYDRAFGGGGGLTVQVVVQGSLIHQNDLMQHVYDGLVDLVSRGVVPPGRI